MRRGTRNSWDSKQPLDYRKILLAVCALVFLVSLILLLNYFVDYISSRRQAQALRAIYRETEAPALLSSPLPEEEIVPAPSLSPEQTTLPLVSPAPAPQAYSGSFHLPALRYPTNYYGRISSRFQKLQRQNPDIIGWLTMEGLVDEAVVQRDNSYYLSRDYLGYHNVNGAIFLEESCDLSTRPYTLLLYGHNMKSFAMFGGLRKYENMSYYREHPFITFDTAYETGRYVIFATGVVSLKSYARDFLNFSKLNSDQVLWRREALEAIRKNSVYYSFVDVKPEDQLLVLVTCVEDDARRRIVVARRIRDGEMETELRKQIQDTFVRQ